MFYLKNSLKFKTTFGFTSFLPIILPLLSETSNLVGLILRLRLEFASLLNDASSSLKTWLSPSSLGEICFHRASALIFFLPLFLFELWWSMVKKSPRLKVCLGVDFPLLLRLESWSLELLNDLFCDHLTFFGVLFKGDMGLEQLEFWSSFLAQFLDRREGKESALSIFGKESSKRGEFHRGLKSWLFLPWDNSGLASIEKELDRFELLGVIGAACSETRLLWIGVLVLLLLALMVLSKVALRPELLLLEFGVEFPKLCFVESSFWELFFSTGFAFLCNFDGDCFALLDSCCKLKTESVTCKFFKIFTGPLNNFVNNSRCTSWVFIL